MGDHPPRILLEVLDDVLVLHVEHHAGRQDVKPMLH
jgi:hypothetical protein